MDARTEVRDKQEFGSLRALEGERDNESGKLELISNVVFRD